MSWPPGDEPPQWQQPHSQWGQQPQQQWQPPPVTPGSATAALVLGICGLVVCWPICAPLALVFGYKARREISDSGGRLTGDGLAVAGIVMGWIGCALTVLVIIWIAGFATV